MVGYVIRDVTFATMIDICMPRYRNKFHTNRPDGGIIQLNKNMSKHASIWRKRTEEVRGLYGESRNVYVWSYCPTDKILRKQFWGDNQMINHCWLACGSNLSIDLSSITLWIIYDYEIYWKVLTHSCLTFCLLLICLSMKKQCLQAPFSVPFIDISCFCKGSFLLWSVGLLSLRERSCVSLVATGWVSLWM